MLCSTVQCLCNKLQVYCTDTKTMSISCWHPATHLHFFPIWAHRGIAMPRACPRETRCSRHRSGLANHNHHHQPTPAFSISWVLFSIFNWEVVWRYNMFVPKTALGMPKVTSKFWGYCSKTIWKKHHEWMLDLGVNLRNIISAVL